MNKPINIMLTGGNGRLGKSISNYLINKGHRVVIGDLKFKKITKSRKNNLFFFKSDLTKEKNIKDFIRFSIKKLRTLDAFIHCSYPKTNDWGNSLKKLKQTSLNKNLNDHLGSSIIFAKNLISYFLKQKKGNIIFLSSIYGITSPRFEDYSGKIYSTVEYGAIKAGIISITKYLAKYYKKRGLRVNAISPGGIKDSQEKKFIDKYKRHCNSKGLLSPGDINGLVNFLLSEESKYINGQNITIDDGWSL